MADFPLESLVVQEVQCGQPPNEGLNMGPKSTMGYQVNPLTIHTGHLQTCKEISVEAPPPPSLAKTCGSCIRTFGRLICKHFLDFVDKITFKLHFHHPQAFYRNLEKSFFPFPENLKVSRLCGNVRSFFFWRGWGYTKFLVALDTQNREMKRKRSECNESPVSGDNNNNVEDEN